MEFVDYLQLTAACKNIYINCGSHLLLGQCDCCERNVESTIVFMFDLITTKFLINKRINQQKPGCSLLCLEVTPLTK